MQQLAAIVTRGEILFDEPLSGHTTYGIGGPADIFVRPADRRELARLLRFATRKKIPVTLIGAGSNCLVSDDGVRGLVISLAGTLQNLHIEGGEVTAESGVMLGRMIKHCLEAGLTGLEGLTGVPGTVGGALAMNARAFGAEISTHLEVVRIINLDGREKVYRRDDLQFGYRSSSLGPNEIILEARFLFKAGAPEALSERYQRISNERKARHPLDQRSAGSVFKNPSSEVAAGMLIDRAGLKGTRRGDAEISTKHANFFINHGEATAEDMAFLIKLAARTVKQQFGDRLELELKTLGFEPGYWEEAGLG